jgi:hypothetical protein
MKERFYIKFVLSEEDAQCSGCSTEDVLKGIRNYLKAYLCEDIEVWRGVKE